MAFDFVNRYKIWFAISGIIIVIGLVFLAIPGKGLRRGIDFTGGIFLDLQFSQPVTTSAVMDSLAKFNLQNSMVQLAGGGVTSTEALIRTKPLGDKERRDMLEGLRSDLGDFQVIRLEEVKGVIGKELTQKALLALLIANIGMIIYITFRFEFKFAISGIVALVHDVLITIGIFAILGMEVNSPFVAAILTIVGYSINDTIVVFDRIRENLKGRKKEPLPALVNRSINETLTRSINTSLTTLLAIGAVLILGGKTTRDFALALMVGITSGTYSSIFIASPLWVLWKTREERMAKAQPKKS